MPLAVLPGEDDVIMQVTIEKRIYLDATVQEVKPKEPIPETPQGAFPLNWPFWRRQLRSGS
jgi:hypothetical protein